MSENLSVLTKARQAYQPKLPVSLKNGALSVKINKGAATESVSDQAKIKELFPNTYGLPVVQFEAAEAKAGKALRMGVVLSGGQAPGGHNVIAGIYDGIKSVSKDSVLFGFLGGPSGLENGKYIEIDDAKMDAYRNAGGFDMIQSGRTKLETEEQFNKCIAVQGR